MYKYETHLHTAPVSKCGRASAEETVAFYAGLGYDGIFITNHFLDGYINIDADKSYQDRIEFFFSDYEQALTLGEKYSIKVFCGAELSYKGTDFLVYGLDKQWFLDHPEIMDMKKTDELTLMAESGALIVQAHPFLEAHYVDHIRLFPRHVHGVEVINAPKKDEEDAMALMYCEHYNLLKFAGSDNHTASAQKKLAGVCCEEPISSVEEFIEKAKAGQLELFTLNLE